MYYLTTVDRWFVLNWLSLSFPLFKKGISVDM